LSSRERLVVLVQPVHKREDIHIPPHPRWKPGKVAECLLCCRIRPGTSGKAVHTIRVRPVALNSEY
jgi:hypothetical protein